MDEKFAGSGLALNEAGKLGMRSDSDYPSRQGPAKRNKKWLALGAIAVLAVILAIAIPVVRVIPCFAPPRGFDSHRASLCTTIRHRLTRARMRAQVKMVAMAIVIAIKDAVPTMR